MRNMRSALALGGATVLLSFATWGMTFAGIRPEPASPTAKAASLAFADLNGRKYGGPEIAANKATVFLFISSECPIANAYSPRFARLAKDYGRQGVQVFGVYAGQKGRSADLKKHAAKHGYAFPLIADRDCALADTLGATMTPQVVVLDADGQIRYRGRFDDNANPKRVTSHDLRNALDALLAGKSVPKPQTVAFGCTIARPEGKPVAAKNAPTYATHVAAILREKCESCHRPGEVAPFSLQTAQEAKSWAVEIKKYTSNRMMPPWKPAPGYGEFLEERQMTLTEAEIATLAQWADAGAPTGDLKKAPPPRKFTQGWQLGDPDVVLTPEKEYHLAADGDDVYRNFVVDPGFTEDTFVNAVEVRPGNNAVVHHVLNFIDARHASRKLEQANKDGQIGYNTFGGVGFLPTGMLGGWAPGNAPKRLPEDVGMFVPKGSLIVIQVHYHKNGSPQTDRTRIGLHLSKKPVHQRVYFPMVLNALLYIPPGAEKHEVRAATAIREDSTVLAVTPHMHLLGREMKVWATLPDGTEKPLVWIKDWDFNWQASYLLKEPVSLPAGSKVHLAAIYDNSSQNPRNPNRSDPKPVTWGEQTTDEMCIAFVTITKDGEKLNFQPKPLTKRAATR